jgi:hypothetical protein
VQSCGFFWRQPTTKGTELRALTSAIVSRRVQGSFVGYLQAQKQRLTGERG